MGAIGFTGLVGVLWDFEYRVYRVCRASVRLYRHIYI